MHPRLFTLPAFEVLGQRLGPFTLHTYGLLLAVAFLAGLWLASRLARRDGLDASRVADLGVYVLIAGLLGAKGLLILVDWKNTGFSPGELLSVLQVGGVFYGGLLAALPVGFWLLHRYQLPRWRTVDVMVPGVVLGQAIGRLGCFAAGCCYGRPADVPWAVTFSDPYAGRTVGTPLGSGLHPSQLYESLAALLILGVLLWIARHKSFHGQVILSYVGLYSATRFGLEFFRGDELRGTLLDGMLSTSQAIALVLLAASAALLPRLRRSQRVAPTPSEPAHP